MSFKKTILQTGRIDSMTTRRDVELLPLSGRKSREEKLTSKHETIKSKL